MDIQKIIQESIQKALMKMDVERDDVFVEMPKDSSNGDYASNIAMILSKELKKNPREIAEEIVKNLEKVEEIEKVEVAGPGFINFYVSDEYLLNILKEVNEKKEGYGRNLSLNGKKIMIEYTDANPFKILHIGHLYSNTVGESLSRLLEASGADVKRACYQGDVGLHVAKTLWGLEKIFEKENFLFEDMCKRELYEKVKILGDAYMYGYDSYDIQKDPKAIEEIERINRYIFSLFVKMPEEDFSELENSDLKNIYEMTREWSLDYFNLIYKRIGTKFDRLYFESEVGNKGLQVVKENLGKIFEEDDGAVIYKGDPDKGLHTRVFVNKQGVPTYEAKEMGLALLKHEEFDFDESIMITANEQDGYFKVVLDAFSKIYPDIAKELKHISHGMVNLPGMRKMSSRKGEILSAEWLINETKKKVFEVMEEKDEGLAEKIAVAAIKYAYLKVAVGRDIAFDFDQAISFNGETGSYLLYVYARCNSILSEVKGEGEYTADVLKNTSTKELVEWVSKYPEVLLISSQNYSPSTLCQYLFDLGQSFNSFYQNVKVLDSNDTQALIPVLKATAQVMKNGLDILGIEVVERM